MRIRLIIPIFLVGCFGVDFTAKVCRSDEGCPPMYYCDTGHCEASLVRYSNIQIDLQEYHCSQVSCHDAQSSTRLAVDTSKGKEFSNYSAIIKNGIVVPFDFKSSPLHNVPVTGNGPTMKHITPISDSTISSWQEWIRAGAVY